MCIGVGGADAVDVMADIPWELKCPKVECHLHLQRAVSQFSEIILVFFVVVILATKHNSFHCQVKV